MPGGRSPKVFVLSTRVYPERGGPVRNNVEDRDGLRMAECRHLAILVHGFNNTESEATERYEIMFARLEEHFRYTAAAPDAVAFLHWPGNHAIGATGALDFFGYDTDLYNSRQSSVRLADFLIGLRRAPTSPLKVTFLGHSMGCRLILETLALLADETSLNIEVIALMAAAVPVDLIKAPEAKPPKEAGRLGPTFKEGRRILKFFSGRDLALRLGFPRAQRIAYWRNIEPDYYNEAVGLRGRPERVGEDEPTTNRHKDYWTDERIAEKYKAAIDSTRRALPSPRELERRELEPRDGIASRRLATGT